MQQALAKLPARGQGGPASGASADVTEQAGGSGPYGGHDLGAMSDAPSMRDAPTEPGWPPQLQLPTMQPIAVAPPQEDVAMQEG